MRLILKDYISTLKEEIELEKLLDNILVMNDYYSIIRPQKGVTQFGVDFSAMKNNEIYLFVLKQKDIDKTNWDTGNNAVRPTLNEIIDSYILQRLNSCDNKINIILCTNGIMKQNIRPAWEGYVRKNSNKRVKFDFWDIDKLVFYSEHFLLNEYMFEDELKSDLRKTLYFYEEDVNFKYYVSLLKKIIKRIDIKQRKNKKYKKSIITYILISKMCIKYAYDRNVKIAINMAERSLILYWEFIMTNRLFSEEKEIELLFNITDEYEKCCETYIENIKKIYEYKPSFPVYNEVEYRLVTYEVIGIIATYTFYLFYYKNSISKRKINNNINLIITLINNNASFYYPIYDTNSIELNILFFLLKETNNSQLDILIETFISKLVDRMITFPNYYPVEYENFDKVLDIEFSEKVEKCKASILFTNILQWLVVIGKEDICKQVYSVIIKRFPQITFNSIEIDSDNEEEYFRNNTRDSIITYIIDYKQDIKNIKRELGQIYNKSKLEKYKFNNYCALPFLFITARNMRIPIPSSIIIQFL